MDKRVKILKKDEIFKKLIFRIDEARLQFERYDGELSHPVTRLNLRRGDSVAALIHDISDNSFILTEQFRYPVFNKDEAEAWLTEIPAGMVGAGEIPEETMRREILEEIGYQVQDLRLITVFFPSPGGSDERIYLYYAQVKPDQEKTAGGGLNREGEDIRRIHIPAKAALSRLKAGGYHDAKTIIALQWFWANRKKLKGDTSA